MCGLNDRPSKVVKRVGEGVNSRDTMAFQHGRDMTHIEAPLLMTILLIRCFV
jgi:hypothetical protein